MARSNFSPTRLFALLGDPVAHSLSPRLHGAAFRSRPECIYLPFRVSKDGAGPVLRALALNGGGGNVTIPHKERAASFLDRPLPAVRATGACNTFWSDSGAVVGDNTDVLGFLGSLEALAGGGPRGMSAAVLGAGGAARAVVYGLLEGGAARVYVWSRTEAKTRRLIRSFGDGRLRLQPEPEPGGRVDLLVNATPVGMRGLAAPIRLGRLAAPPGRVLDLVYRDGPTPLEERARALGIPAMSGLEALILQAEAAQERWFGEPPPKGVIRGAVQP